MASANVFGNLFTLTGFGESHGPALGAVIDGCPAGVPFLPDLLNRNLQRRKPGQSAVTTARSEEDVPEILSGVYQGKTLGTPIAVLVRNHDARSKDYENMKARSGHADDVWLEKFGIADPRGGGRASGRETLSRVIGGSFAQMLLRELAPELKVLAFTTRIGPIELAAPVEERLSQMNSDHVDQSQVRTLDLARERQVVDLLTEAKENHKSYGGQADIFVFSPPRGLGAPVFHKLKSELAKAYLSIGATSAVEVGAGLDAGSAEGSEFHVTNVKAEKVANTESVYGGIRGGISTGETIRCRVTFKPTSSFNTPGRHDPCIVPRAIPVLEAMTYLVLADLTLWQRLDRLNPTAQEI